uniref:Helicase C-terminal domain-containing protein n=1 Tax=Glossina palpalis gambiensis TaxID=67801 RepID=A0A1B0BFD3_9MUSC
MGTASEKNHRCVLSLDSDNKSTKKTLQRTKNGQPMRATYPMLGSNVSYDWLKLSESSKKPLKRIRKMRDTILRKRAQMGDVHIKGPSRELKPTAATARTSSCTFNNNNNDNKKKETQNNLSNVQIRIEPLDQEEAEKIQYDEQMQIELNKMFENLGKQDFGKGLRTVSLDKLDILTRQENECPCPVEEAKDRNVKKGFIRRQSRELDDSDITKDLKLVKKNQSARLLPSFQAFKSSQSFDKKWSMNQFHPNSSFLFPLSIVEDGRLRSLYVKKFSMQPAAANFHIILLLIDYSLTYPQLQQCPNHELTGDMQLTKTEMSETQILVTTPEKWDVVTRKRAGEVSLISLVKLLIIDKVHLLHGERGPVVEALVANTLRLVESSQTIQPLQQLSDTDQVCYQKCVEQLQHGDQVMVFVHARNATVRTASTLCELAQQNNTCALFLPDTYTSDYGLAIKAIQKSRNKKLVELFSAGIAVHHTGMLRTDRHLVEKYFSEGYIKVLVCTATLAWGVNLVAHIVIIKGTDIYDSKHGTFVDLGIVDVLQIFGCAGGPQFDKSDNVNAEIVLATITNVEEVIEWLSYTYLFVRMRINPHVYEIEYVEVKEDPSLERKRRALIVGAAMSLDKARMIRFKQRTLDFNVTDLGRTA